MTNLLKGHEDFIVSHTRKEIMQKFNVNYNYVNYFCAKNGLKPIAERSKYHVTDEMKDFLKEHTVAETAYKFHVGYNWLSIKVREMNIPCKRHRSEVKLSVHSCKHTGEAQDMIRFLSKTFTMASIARVFGYTRERIRQICAKEYENKCLAQKIECIKELEKENAELKEQRSILADSNASNDFFEKEEAQTCLSYTHYIKIPFKGESPIYSTKYAAGADIVLPKDVVAKAHSIVTWIDLEVGFDIPEGFCIMLQPRSSTSRKWHVLTDTGIIDSDYKLENIHCSLVNVTDEDIKIPKGTRIVQLLILPVYHATNWKCFNNIRNSKKGSGSTGD